MLQQLLLEDLIVRLVQLGADERRNRKRGERKPNLFAVVVEVLESLEVVVGHCRPKFMRQRERAAT